MKAKYWLILLIFACLGLAAGSFIAQKRIEARLVSDKPLLPIPVYVYYGIEPGETLQYHVLNIQWPDGEAERIWAGYITLDKQFIAKDSGQSLGMVLRKNAVTYHGYPTSPHGEEFSAFYPNVLYYYIRPVHVSTVDKEVYTNYGELFSHYVMEKDYASLLKATMRLDGFQPNWPNDLPMQMPVIDG